MKHSQRTYVRFDFYHKAHKALKDFTMEIFECFVLFVVKYFNVLKS